MQCLWLARSKVFELTLIILNCGHFSSRYDRDQGVLRCESRIEVAHIEDIRGECGAYWCLDASLQNLLVVQFREPGVCQHFFQSPTGAQTIGWVFLEQLNKTKQIRQSVNRLQMNE